MAAESRGHNHLRRRDTVQVVSQRNTRAVDYQHPLHALAALGLAHARPPFFAGAKLPSVNISSHASCFFRSASPATPARRRARRSATPSPAADASRCSVRGIGPAAPSTAPRSAAPRGCPRTPGGWAAAWARPWPRYETASKDKLLPDVFSCCDHAARCYDKGGVRVRAKDNSQPSRKT
jgi:hypothetical protein